MAHDGLADMDREATEEDDQERQPCEVFGGVDKTAAFGTVAQDGKEAVPKP
jgi:hypothetical protein